MDIEKGVIVPVSGRSSVKLRVYGTTKPIDRDLAVRLAPDGGRVPRSARFTVAATSLTAACRLLHVTRDYCSETGNADEVRASLEHPGVPLAWPHVVYRDVIVPVAVNAS